ncbi:LysR family transcriptional regulator [Planktothrix sp. FACHB-1355]|uniref:LysR family transcriptional regulator n=1 Tax=Aerosakkonema funiforme FACHB-1375 TaxID=2949571 RepID=A0A926VM87_9CYAN|nr:MULTISPECIES: LysR family transcriptional regulator [Oscillatoriales]MBD2186406.1 LysR family transcriptional regulator [Aerosakkonema funiforme FACHB-1375]MBD3563442.1 LysR family transcriptional regulator [Planktothrix sp. FACHB-1355]
MKSIDLGTIDLNLLVAFEALFEERSVTAAARRLYLGQPAMSAALGRLRSLFKDELFIRIGAKMEPTSKCKALAPGILLALQQIRQTIEFNRSFNPASSQRSFAIGSSDSVSYVLMPKLWEICQQTAPGINLRLMAFEKDNVKEMLEQGIIDVALGVFPNPPQQTSIEPLFQERFIGIARQGHPALIDGSISRETFVSLPHALFTMRRDATGEIDKLLARYHLQRRVALTISHALAIPEIVSKSNLVAAIPSRLAKSFISLCPLQIFEVPLETEPWTVSLLWSKLVDKDLANSWLRQTIKTVCQAI